MRILGRVLLLLALWLLAWGQVTVANVVSGIAVASGLLVAFPPVRRAGHRLQLRPAGVVWLAGYVLIQLVSSNLVMAHEVLKRRSSARPGVLAHRLQRPSEEIVTLMTSVISLSPGTMTVDVDRDSVTIYVHFLFLSDVNAARRGLTQLERLAVGAIAAPGGHRSHIPASPKEPT
jgi:multicomponent Na+:H+ antiporter subunit E